MSNEEFRINARSDESQPVTGADEVKQLIQDLDRGAVSIQAHPTADGRNPGCSGK